MPDDNLRVLTIFDIVQQDGDDTAPPLLIAHDDRGRLLEIPLGMCEALAVRNALMGEKISRPLTHDLLFTLTEQLEAPLRHAVIDDFSNDLFYARLVLQGADGEVSLDCRPSDAIALALRAGVPIFVTDAVMDGYRA
jgi:bifunctional DNase/RNase